MLLSTVDGEVSVLETPVLSDTRLMVPVLYTPVPAVPVPMRITPVLKAEPEAKTVGAAKPFAVELV